MIDCFRKTFIKEGFGGLYKGASSPLAGAMFHNAGVFFSYGKIFIYYFSYIFKYLYYKIIINILL